MIRKKTYPEGRSCIHETRFKIRRAHFYAPYKQMGNIRIDTLLFNVLAIWLMTFGLFVTLYFNLLKRFIEFLEALKLPIWRKFGRELLQG